MKGELFMKVKRGYKLFEQSSKGELFPLFIDKRNAIPIGEWVDAEIHPTKGYSVRPGWHIGDVCSAPWLMSADGTYKSQRSKRWKRVWCEVEYIADNDYTDIVKTISEKCLKNKLPDNGFYFFKETGVGRIWIIADKMRINRIITEDERMSILNGIGYNEQIAFEPYRKSFEKRLGKVS